MRKLIFDLHLYVALATGIIVLILGVTGGIMAFETELSDLFHAKLVYIKPGTNPLSLGEMGAVVSNAFPGERIKGYTIPGTPNRSYGVALNHKTVHVNPYTGVILGVHVRPDNADTFLDRVHQFHLRLLVTNKADSGKQIVRWACVLMLFLPVSGVYLWWPGKRIKVQCNGPAIWKTRAFWYDLHNTLGIFSLVFILVLTITGIAIGFQRQATTLFSRMTRSELVYPPDVHLTPPSDGKPITPDQAIAIARGALPGAAPFEINVPQPTQAYDIRTRFPEDRTPAGRSRVLVEPYTGKVIFAQGSRTAPAAQRLVILNRAIHTGDIFGFPSKLVMSLASFALGTLVLSGVVMWLKRIRKQARLAIG